MISEQKVEAAVKFYRDIAEDIGDLYGQVWYLDHKRKIIRAELFNEADGTVAQREAYAESHPDYINVVEEARDAVTALNTEKTKLKAAELTIEVWRSQFAASKRGHI